MSDWFALLGPVGLVTLWAMFLMFVGVIALRVVSKARVHITLDANDMEALSAGRDISVTTNSVVTTLRYEARQ